MDRSICTYNLTEYERDSYFIGANSEKGFILTPGGIFEEENFDRVFILKGGPGTGKSTFMKKAAKDAEKKGHQTVRYYCSSDPSSLDALIIVTPDKRILIIDGTHPHIREMKYPGAVSEIINLSIMWDTEDLSSQTEIIKELTKRKSDCFKSTYKYLSAAAELSRSLVSISERFCNTDKMKAATERFISPYKRIEGATRKVYTEAFSMKGTVAIDTYFKIAKQTYYVSDFLGLSLLYMNNLSEKLSKENVSHTKIVSPVNSETVSGIFIEEAEILVTHENYSERLPKGKKINMKRFVTEEYKAFKGRYRFGEKCKNALLEGAADSLHLAEKYHFELENIYVSAMNFKKVSKIYRERILPVLDT